MGEAFVADEVGDPAGRLSDRPKCARRLRKSLHRRLKLGGSFSGFY